MRAILIILFTAFIFNANAQSFVNFKDTVNHFSIDIPAGWKYGPPQTPSGIKLIAIRGPLKEGEIARDNFNINIINKLESQDLEKNFANLERAASTRPNYKLVNKGDTTINGQQFMWLIATHANKTQSEIQMLSYNFVTLKDGKAYLLTMSTWPSYFETVKPMFDKIAGSFILY